MLRALLFIILLASGSAYADTRIHDGDTLTLEDQRIRLWGIDAPELAQLCQHGSIAVECGKQSRDALKAYLQNKEVQCEVIDTDRYRRSVARCTADGEDINAYMVTQGWALDYGRYSRGYYSAQERAAKAAAVGVWQYEFIKPWEWRSAK